MQIETINWQGKRIPEGLDKPDKTLFVADGFASKFANIILWPLESEPKQHAKPLSEILGIDALTLKGQLSGRGFMAPLRGDNVTDMSARVTALTAAGYRARMVRDDMFFRLPVPRRAVSVAFPDGGAVHFTFAGGAAPIVAPQNEPAFCVLTDMTATRQMARIREADTRAASPPQPFSFTAIMDHAKAYTCDIYFPYQWAAVRLISDNFIYTCLGSRATQCSGENMGLLLDTLAAFPLCLVWDDRFPETAVIGMRKQIESVTVADKIVTQLHDDANDQVGFNYYSRFRYILEMAGGFKCFS